jgi:eukaryotic-like serine/threonine-protein kinase
MARANAEPAARLEPLFEIGRGGVAVVRAERVTLHDGSTRVAAVKRMLPLVAGDPKTREMFFAEARLAAMLDHPNIAGILALGLADDDPYIVMELVVGEPLSAVMAAARERAQQPLDPALAAMLMAQVCDALHAAHELRDAGDAPLQLVHRDVSPQNILLGFEGCARLTDFGIAKALGFGSRTRTGEVKGKLPYMSPEQVMCDPLDRRSDLFAVGAVLFELIHGHRMWGEGSELEVMRKLSAEPAPRLEAPEPLSALHASLVARDAQARPATAMSVAHALRAFAGIDETAARSKLSERMGELFPGRKESAEQGLRAGAALAVGSTASEPSRRRAAAWLVPIAVLLVAGALAALQWSRPRTDIASVAPPAVVSESPQPSDAAAAIAAPQLAPSDTVPVPPRGPSAVPARRVPETTQPAATPSQRPPAVRTEKLDERPF